MNLFKSLLLAPTAIGLIAPISVIANELNLKAISDYSSSEVVGNISQFNPIDQPVTNSRVDTIDPVFNEFEAGSFSETTTATFSADFAIGAVQGKGISSGVTDGDEVVQAAYGYQIDLNTSFTGEDSLDVSIDAGNPSATTALAEFDLNSTTDVLTLDGISYTFPLGDKTSVMVGDNIDGSALFTTACGYGGPSDTLSSCGNVNAAIENGGAMFGASYDIGNGFTAAVGYAGPETGILTKESLDAYGANFSYAADNYGVSLTYAKVETAATTDDDYTAINGYYSLDNGLSVSAGYEIGNIGGAVATEDESRNYFFGLSTELGVGEFGAAVGTSGGQVEGQDEELMYEAYYSYPVNDSMTVTPLVYVKEQATAGTPDQTGVMVKTSFSF